MTEKELRSLSNYHDSDAFGPEEKLVLDLSVAMTATPPSVTDELFAALQKHFTDAQLVELVSEIGMANFRGRFNRAFLCQPAGYSKGAYCPMPEA